MFCSKFRTQNSPGTFRAWTIFRTSHEDHRMNIFFNLYDAYIKWGLSKRPDDPVIVTRESFNGGMPKRKGTSTNHASVSANKKACQRYKQEYSTFWKCLQASTEGETHARYVTCQIDFSCAHGGRFDCKRHIETKSHKDFEILTTKNKSMTDFCINSSQANKSAETRKRNQTKAELMICTILAQNNLSFI